MFKIIEDFIEWAFGEKDEWTDPWSEGGENVFGVVVVGEPESVLDYNYPEPTDDEIRLRAYFLWYDDMVSGCTEDEKYYWYKAENLLNDKIIVEISQIS